MVFSWELVGISPGLNRNNLQLIFLSSSRRLYSSVDGGFAGQTGNLKKFSLQPGNHDVEIRDAEGMTIYHQTVAVISDRTTEIKLNS